MSPFFSLPDGDETGNAQHSQSADALAPITLSCAGCERIVGDSSAFLCATRSMATVTLERMVSVEIGREGLKTSLEGEWDEFWLVPCNYKDISCGKCLAHLGKMYFATTAKLSMLQNKYTVNISALSVYHHGSSELSLPVAATQEICQQLHPSPDAIAESIDHLMTMCVMLREEQGDIIREVKKLGMATGVEVTLEEDEDKIRFDDEAGRGWKEKLEGLGEKVQTLEELIESLKFREKEFVKRWGRKEKDFQEDRKKWMALREEWFKFMQEQKEIEAAQQPQTSFEHPVVTFTLNGHARQNSAAEKEKSNPSSNLRSGKDLSPASAEEMTRRRSHQQKKPVPNREIPNSQSFDGFENEDTEEEVVGEAEADRIKSPPVKRRRRGVTEVTPDGVHNGNIMVVVGKGKEDDKGKEKEKEKEKEQETTKRRLSGRQRKMVK
ncbi:Protein Mis18-alpha [Rhizina undulata]